MKKPLYNQLDRQIILHHNTTWSALAKLQIAKLRFINVLMKELKFISGGGNFYVKPNAKIDKKNVLPPPPITNNKSK